MFSDDGVSELSREFVCVKLDPRETREASEYKTTRYVPEIVFLDSELNVLGTLEGRDVESAISEMRDMLEAARR